MNELPGVDPVSDVDVTARRNRLTIEVLRTRTSESSAISEFCYGFFSRTVSLPEGADEDDIGATYDRDILTVSTPLSDGEAHQEKGDDQPQRDQGA